MREGYSVLWTGWNWDVENPSPRPPQRIFLPIIVNPDGSSLVERINAEITVQVKDGVKVDWLAWGGSRCYSVADDPTKLQQAATSPCAICPTWTIIGPRTVIPRADWQFARLVDNVTTTTVVNQSGNAMSYYQRGSRRGRSTRFSTDAKNPRVVGLGLAAIRDAISFFHFETQDDYANPNPLAVPHKKSKGKIRGGSRVRLHLRHLAIRVASSPP